MARHLLPYLRDHFGAENIIICAPVFEQARTSEWEGMKVVPGVSWDYGENVLEQHYNANRCNVLLHVGDAWPLGLLPDLASAGRVFWVSWLAVDWLGMPKNILYRIREAHKLVPFTRYGYDALLRGGLDNVEPPILLGIDPNIWRPIPHATLGTAMAQVNFSYSVKALNILIVGANQERKQLRAQLEAVSLFARTNKEAEVHLYLHSAAKGDRDLLADLDELDLVQQTRMPDPYLIINGGASEEDMAQLFNCADVVSNVCQEGFGMSVLQAQACGVDVITMTESGSYELLKAGWEVAPATGVITTPHQMAQALAYPPSIAGCLQAAWEMKQQAGRVLRHPEVAALVRSQNSWAKVAEQWIDTLDRIMMHQEHYCVSIPEPSPRLASVAKVVL